MSVIVLLLAPEGAGHAAAEGLRRALDAEVHLQTNVSAAVSSLRSREYSLLLLDETLVSGDDVAAEDLYGHAAAPVLELDFALCSAPRIVRRARAALYRRSRDLANAENAAASLLHSELKQTLAGLLLESELALRHASPEQQPRLREVVQMAGSLRDRLRESQQTL